MSKKPQPPQSQKTTPAPQAIEVNTKDANGYTPLHRAVISGKLDEVKRLLAHPNIQVNTTDSTIHGLAPLDYAAMGNNVEMVQALLAHPEIKVNTKDTSGYSALHRAVGRSKNPEIPKILLAHKKINVNPQSSKGYTPLHTAVRDNNVEMVQVLLKHPKIDVLVKDKNGDTAFSLLYTKKGEKFNDAIYTKLADHIKAESKKVDVDIPQLTEWILKLDPPRRLNLSGSVIARPNTISVLQYELDEQRREKRGNKQLWFDHKIHPYDTFVNSSSVVIAHLINKMEKTNPDIKGILRNPIILNNSSLDLVRKIHKVRNILDNNRLAHKIAGFVIKQPALQEKELEDVLKKIQTHISTMQDSAQIVEPMKKHMHQPTSTRVVHSNFPRVPQSREITKR